MPTDTIILQTIVAACFAKSLIPNAMWRRHTGEFVGFRSNLLMLYFVFLVSFVGSAAAASYDAGPALLRTGLMVGATFFIGWLLALLACRRHYRQLEQRSSRDDSPPAQS